MPGSAGFGRFGIGRQSALIVAFLVGVVACAWPVVAQVPQDVGGVFAQGALGESTIASGLREALRVAAQNAVSRTGRVDGFFKNEAIKILMPDRLRPVETGLRAIGFGSKVDEFVLAMNRAAEQAAASATPVFINAVSSMSIADARSILSGGDTAATEYFRTHTQDQLATAFRPIVQRATDDVGVTRQYKDLIKGIPFGNTQSLDIDEYVVGKTLDGLFYVMGEEEKRIRKDPAARVSEILRQVFGQR